MFIYGKRNTTTANRNNVWRKRTNNDQIATKTKMNEEIFPIVNENGETIGSATRSECHSGSFLLHPVVHLHIFNERNELYLQKRSINKDVQPGKWDTSVGGHINLN